LYENEEELVRVKILYNHFGDVSLENAVEESHITAINREMEDEVREGRNDYQGKV
jgi:hypothetical protein